MAQYSDRNGSESLCHARFAGAQGIIQSVRRLPLVLTLDNRPARSIKAAADEIHIGKSQGRIVPNRLTEGIGISRVAYELLAKLRWIGSDARPWKLVPPSARVNWHKFDGHHGRIDVGAVSASLFSSNFGRGWPLRLSRECGCGDDEGDEPDQIGGTMRRTSWLVASTVMPYIEVSENLVVSAHADVATTELILQPTIDPLGARAHAVATLLRKNKTGRPTRLLLTLQRFLHVDRSFEGSRR